MASHKRTLISILLNHHIQTQVLQDVQWPKIKIEYNVTNYIKFSIKEKEKIARSR